MQLAVRHGSAHYSPQYTIAHRRLRQEDHEVKFSLGYRVRLHLRK